MIQIIQNKIIAYNEKIENYFIYKDSYLYELKIDIINSIVAFNKKNRKKAFSFQNFIKNNSTQTNINLLFCDAYNLYKQIDNISYEDFYKKELEIYKKEFFCKKSFRSYKYFLKNQYKKIHFNLDIEITLKNYFNSVFNLEIDKAAEIAGKQQKGRKSNNFMVEVAKTVPLYDKKLRLDKDVNQIIKTKEMQLIINNNQIKNSHFMSAIQRKAFVLNDVFFNKILSYFILNNFDIDKLHTLRKNYFNLVKE